MVLPQDRHFQWGSRFFVGALFCFSIIMLHVVAYCRYYNYYWSSGPLQAVKLVMPGTLIAKDLRVVRNRDVFSLRFIVQIGDGACFQAEIRNGIAVIRVFDIKLLGPAVRAFQVLHDQPPVIFLQFLFQIASIG